MTCSEEILDFCLKWYLLLIECAITIINSSPTFIHFLVLPAEIFLWKVMFSGTSVFHYILISILTLTRMFTAIHNPRQWTVH